MPFPTLNRDSLYHYNEIRMMVLENLPTSVICDRFDYGSSQEFQLERCLGWTIKHLVSKEKEFDLIPISDFFENNWQNKLLFYTPRHPTGFVMAELVRRICNKLNLPIYDDELQKIIKKDHFSHIKLYIPFWIRKNYLSNIPELNDETFYSLSAVDTVSLYTNLYRLLPEGVMSKKLFVHAGLHKTGSTTIQFYCNKYRNDLTAQGLLYPLYIDHSQQKHQSHLQLIKDINQSIALNQESELKNTHIYKFLGPSTSR